MMIVLAIVLLDELLGGHSEREREGRKSLHTEEGKN